MVDVVATYQSTVVHEWDDTGASPTAITVNLATAPANGDVLLALVAFAGGGSTVVERGYPNLALPGGAISGCGLSGWQKAFWYNSGAASTATPLPYSAAAAEVENSTYNPDTGYGNIYPYLCRATGAATSGTLTFDLDAGVAGNSITVTVLVIRGLPDTGADLSHTLLPRYRTPDQGGAFTTDQPYDAGGLLGMPYGELWAQGLINGPGNASGPGYPVMPDQIVVTAVISDVGDGLVHVDGSDPMTALPTQSLGMVTSRWAVPGVDPTQVDTWSTGSVMVRYATPSTLGHYGYKPDYALTDTGSPTYDGRGDGLFLGDKGRLAALMLILGPGSPDVAGETVGSGVIPMTGSVLGYHASGTSRDVPFPPEAGIGDLCVVIVANRYLASLPAGWSTYITRSGTNQSGRVFYRVLSSADIAAGKVTYTLAQAGTGGFAVMTFKAGTFRSGDPFAGEVDSINPDINEEMPYQVVGAGQNIIHYAHGRTAALSGAALSSEGMKVASRNMDYDSISALYVENARLGDTTLNTTWTGTVATTGAFKFSFVLNSPPAAIIWGPQWDAVGLLMVAVYETVPLSPEWGEYVMSNTPDLVVLADGTPEPFSVQFQTSATAAFSLTLWTGTLTGQVSGTVSIQPAVLLANTTTWWRARAGDGTSWGPWSTPRPVSYYPGRSAAQEYQHNNVGAELVLVSDGLEYQHNNVGLPATLSPNAGDYLHNNVGFQVVLDRRGGDYLHENVYVGVPVPHLWFAWLEYGFVNDHVFIVGQGLGTLMTEYNATIKLLDKSGATVVSHTCSVFDWSVNPAGVHAYDALRRIYKGSDAAPFDVTQEADVVEIIVPTGAVPTTAQTDYYVAQTNGGTSNEIPFLIYPLIPTPMEGSAGTSRSGSSVYVDPHQDTSIPIEQIHIAFTPAAVTVVGGMLERPPQTLVTARSTFTLNSTSATADLEDPVDVPIPLSARWRGLTSSITPRPDLGTGVSLWEPLSGSVNAWKIVNGSDPYVDATYDVITRNGVYGRPAMIFPGDAWVELTENLPLAADSVHLDFTAVVVATLYPTAGAILATALDTAQPGGTQPLSLQLRGDQVGVYYGVSANPILGVQVPSDYLSQRPVIVALTVTVDPVAEAANQYVPVGRLTVVAASSTTKKTSLSPLANTSRLWMGRQTDMLHGVQRMDVLDVAIGDSLTQAEEAAMISAYDSAYGVSQG